jgi:hypothetical protein
MSKGDSIALQVLCVLLNVIFFFAFSLFFVWRKRFPISKRFPKIVLLQIFLISFLGTYLMSVPALPNSTSEVNCFWFNFIFLLAFYAVVLLILVRMLFLWNLHFHSQLLEEFHHLNLAQVQDLLMKAKLSMRTRYWFYQHRNFFLRISLFVGLALVEEVEVGVQLVNMFQQFDPSFTAVRGSAQCKGFLFALFKDGIIRFALISGLLLFAFIRILKVKENFGLVNEMKALLVCLCFHLSYSAICIAFPAIIGSTAHFIILGFAFEVAWLVSTVFSVLIWTYRLGINARSTQVSIEAVDHPPRNSANEIVMVPPLRQLTGKYLLKQVLTNEQGHALFYEFLQREFALENLLFWDSVESFKLHFEIGTLTVSEVEEMTNKFVLPNAVLCVNISAISRDEIIEGARVFKREKSHESRQLSLMKSMLKAQQEIVQVMLLDCFLRFKESPEGEAFIRALQIENALSDDTSNVPITPISQTSERAKFLF